MSLALLCCLASHACIASIMDTRHGRIPDALNLTAATVYATLRYFEPSSVQLFALPVPSLLVCATWALGFLIAGTILVHFLPRSIGYGDVKFLSAVVIPLGPWICLGGFWVACLMALLAAALRPGGLSMGLELRFAPYLSAGILVATIQASLA